MTLAARLCAARPPQLQALLHGHSYTAFPVGCASTVAAIDILTSPGLNPNLCSPAPGAAGAPPTCAAAAAGGPACGGPCGRLVEMWRREDVAALAEHPLVAHVVALGTVRPREGFAGLGLEEAACARMDQHAAPSFVGGCRCLRPSWT